MSFNAGMQATHSEMSYGSFSENDGPRKVFFDIGPSRVIITVDEAEKLFKAVNRIIVDAKSSNNRLAREQAAAARKAARATKKTTRKVKRGAR